MSFEANQWKSLRKRSGNSKIVVLSEILTTKLILRGYVPNNKTKAGISNTSCTLICFLAAKIFYVPWKPQKNEGSKSTPSTFHIFTPSKNQLISTCSHNLLCIIWIPTPRPPEDEKLTTRLKGYQLSNSMEVKGGVTVKPGKAACQSNGWWFAMGVKVNQVNPVNPSTILTVVKNMFFFLNIFCYTKKGLMILPLCQIFVVSIHFLRGT